MGLWKIPSCVDTNHPKLQPRSAGFCQSSGALVPAFVSLPLRAAWPVQGLSGAGSSGGAFSPAVESYHG